ncbi:helix-turn-helix domain-containing protein [Paenibacillus sp. FSL R7-0652]|uniref:Helix-turn-helix domain-containing protein n=1 Tax=Paenibacillus sp. AN1007 TaxID=3151385 RepID=A0AAU8N818_9BACL
MNKDSIDFYEAVRKAQNGDQESMQQIIDAFEPIIQRLRYQVRPQERDDLSQSIVEGLMIKIKNYNLDNVPTYAEFCRQIMDNNR